MTAAEYQAAHAKKPAKRKANPEYAMQCAFMRAMTLTHPDVLVFSDTAAHIGKTKLQQVRANRLSSPNEKWPDVFMPEPSDEFCGLYLEFKVECPYKIDGKTLYANPHIQAQAETMRKLRAKGYACYFVWSVEMALEIVEGYLDA